MTAYRRRRHRSLLTTAWWGGALTTALALIGLLVISGVPGSPQLALRADSYNQMTGIGSTSSAVTVNWTSGLLDSSNNPITTTTSTDGSNELNPNSARAAGTGTLSFYDSDFKTLQVTVSETENIGHQGITVSWSGMPAPPNDSPQVDFMQMMECYGDSSAGPSPEDCMYGSLGMLGSNPANSDIGNRGGYTCGTGTVPSASAPPFGVAGDPSYGCDTFEPAAETPAHCDSNAVSQALTCAGGRYYVPFVPVNNPSTPLYEQTSQTGSSLASVFNEFSTNEVQFAATTAQGLASASSRR